jgi:DNA-binding NarL/FixJ family response regulator
MEGWAMRASDTRVKPELLFVDSKRLRQAGITRLLEIWADTAGLTVNAVVPDTLLDACCTTANCGMIVISVGSASIQDGQQQALIETVRRLSSHAPLVIISDLEDPPEICAAFEQGAVGFMPTSTEPAVAFQALSLIRCGGSYFPPSVLSTCVRVRKIAVNGVDHRSDLTAKQEEVFDLLRQGHSNKTIARQLSMSEATVKVHVRRIIHKFGVANRTQLAVAAMNQGSLRATVSDSGDGKMIQLSACESVTQH